MWTVRECDIIGFVVNVILVGRLEPPLTLALSVWLLRERVNIWEFIGAIAAFVGVILTIILQSPTEGMMNMGGFSLGIGELLAAAGSVAIAVSMIIGKKHLWQIPLGIYSIFRTALGTVIFFLIALVVYGSDHFAKGAPRNKGLPENKIFQKNKRQHLLRMIIIFMGDWFANVIREPIPPFHIP